MLWIYTTLHRESCHFSNNVTNVEYCILFDIQGYNYIKMDLQCNLFCNIFSNTLEIAANIFIGL